MTGAIEVGLVVALFATRRWRPRVGLALGAYLVGVFPGNVCVDLPAVTGPA